MPAGVESFNVTLRADSEFARTLLAGLEQAPGPDFQFGRKEYSEMLLDQPIPLGPMEGKVRGARVSPEELEVLRLCATGKSRRKKSLCG